MGFLLNIILKITVCSLIYSLFFLINNFLYWLHTEIIIWNILAKYIINANIILISPAPFYFLKVLLNNWKLTCVAPIRSPPSSAVMHVFWLSVCWFLSTVGRALFLSSFHGWSELHSFLLGTHALPIVNPHKSLFRKMMTQEYPILFPFHLSDAAL